MVELSIGDLISDQARFLAIEIDKLAISDQ
jgi:hypothetical protein